jgi:hypothetical protein
MILFGKVSERLLVRAVQQLVGQLRLRGSQPFLGPAGFRCSVDETSPQHSLFQMLTSTVLEVLPRSFCILLRRRSATTTTKATSEAWSKLARSTAFLALTSVTATVASFAVTTRSASATRASLTVAITPHHSTWRSMRALLLDVCGRHDFGGQVKPFPEVIETFRGQSVVVVLPGELGLEVTTGSQRLASFDDLHARISLHSPPGRPDPAQEN